MIVGPPTFSAHATNHFAAREKTWRLWLRELPIVPAGRETPAHLRLTRRGAAQPEKRMLVRTETELQLACDFVAAAFSADAQYLVCVTAAPDATAVGFEWQKGKKIFTTRLVVDSRPVDVSTISYQPFENTSLATCGPDHLQLWRLSGHHLKPQSAVKCLALDDASCGRKD